MLRREGTVPRSRVNRIGILAVVSVVIAGMSIGDFGQALPRAKAAPPAVAAAAEDLTGDITFSVPSGTFQGQVSVQLSTTIADAQIRYTTNGTVPTASSTLYTGSALTLSATTQLRAQAFVGGAASGAMGTSLYVARSINANHDLPLVVIDSYGGGKPTRDTRDAAVMLMAPENNASTLAQTPTIATRAGFHLRGQSSSNFEKAPYRLEFWDNEDSDADYPVLGMPADSDWVLRGPFPDKTLIRDAFAYTLGQDMGLKAPRFRFVELYLNTDNSPMAADDYRGVYLLDETIKRSPDRLNIQKLKKTDLAEPEISGGYILQFNLLASEPPTLTCTRPTQQTPCWSDLEVVEPKDLEPAQQTWITNYIQKFHDSLRSANPSNPQTGYPAYIDVNSFIDRIIHNELAREGDSYMRSTHFYKDRGGKLVAGPLWDYDLGYNAVPPFGGGGANAAVQGWQYQGFGGGFGTSDWFQKLMADPTFLAQVKARWRTLRQGVLSDAQLIARMNSLSTPLTNAAARNFQRWPNLNTVQVGGFQTQTTQTWQQQLTMMQTFLTQRAAWLDSASGWGGAAVAGAPATQVRAGSAITTAADVSKGCTASYAVTKQWQSGFQAGVKVSAGKAAIKGWKVTVTYADGERINRSWDGKFSTSGSTVSVTNTADNGALAAGADVGFGFTGTRTGTGSVPTLTCTAT
jgi:hypothetical protein